MKDGACSRHSACSPTSNVGGPNYIERMLSELSKEMQTASNMPTYMRHNVTNLHVEMARGDTYFLNVNDYGLAHLGRWRDCFTRDDGHHWLFASREVVEGMTEASCFNGSIKAA